MTHVNEEQSTLSGEMDAIDEYFECVTACSIGNEGIECTTRCIEVHLKLEED